MALITFAQWLESTAHTRLRADIAKGLKPVAGMGSLHGHSTAKPSEVKSISKKIKESKKKVAKNPESPKLDSWLSELDGLEKSVQKLNDILSKKKKDFKSKVQTSDKSKKPEEEKDQKKVDPKKPLAKEPDKSKIVDSEEDKKKVSVEKAKPK